MTAKKTDARRNLSRATTRKFIAGRHLPTREPTPAEEPCKGAAGSKARLVRVRFHPYLNARVTPDRHQTAAFTSDKSLRQRQVNDCVYVVLAASVLGNPHSPNKNRTLGFGHHPGKFSHSVPRNAAARFQFLPRDLFKHLPQLLKTCRMAANEFVVQPLFVDHVLEHTVEKGNVIARLHYRDLPDGSS
jgi:hypothetical protein